MDTEIKVEIVHRESIIPSSPTPDHLRNYNLSILDQLTPHMDVPLILYYPISNGFTLNPNFISQRSNLLKSSLSQTLSHYYPFAGRLKNNFWVDCNDNGVDFIQTKVNFPLSKVLEKPDLDMLKLLLPIPIESKEIFTSSLLHVQVNFFECGGMVIGLNISHKIGDASTLSTFVKNWASTSCSGNSTKLVLPIFDGSIHFPPLDFLSFESPQVEFQVQEKCTTRRYVFDASKIASLQLKSASKTVPNPTRVESVSALIWKCAIEASRSNNSNFDFIRPSVFCQIMNTRKRLVPCLPESIVGNFVSVFSSKTEEIEIELQELVVMLRKGMKQVCENYKTGLGFEVMKKGLVEYGSLLKHEDIECYSCSSWCRFPLYDTNFGWGKPKWVSFCSATLKNLLLLVDTSDGNGIEAWMVFSDDQDMDLFDSNDEMKAFSRFNPSVV